MHRNGATIACVSAPGVTARSGVAELPALVALGYPGRPDAPTLRTLHLHRYGARTLHDLAVAIHHLRLQRVGARAEPFERERALLRQVGGRSVPQQAQVAGAATGRAGAATTGMVLVGGTVTVLARSLDVSLKITLPCASRLL